MTTQPERESNAREVLAEAFDAQSLKASAIATRAGRFDQNPWARAGVAAMLAFSTAETVALLDRVDRLERALVSEREDNLWYTYATGHERDGRWTHMFMSDGEALAQACGFNPRDADYDAAAIKAAIPVAARAALNDPAPHPSEGDPA